MCSTIVVLALIQARFALTAQPRNKNALDLIRPQQDMIGHCLIEKKHEHVQPGKDKFQLCWNENKTLLEQTRPRHDKYHLYSTEKKLL